MGNGQLGVMSELGCSEKRTHASIKVPEKVRRLRRAKVSKRRTGACWRRRILLLCRHRLGMTLA